MKQLIPSLFFYKDVFDLNKLTKVDMPLNKKKKKKREIYSYVCVCACGSVQVWPTNKTVFFSPKLQYKIC